MIASVIPIKRMPRHLSPFDYRVPDTLEGKILVGQLVRIPLRKSIEFGLVFSIKNTDTQEGGVKDIDSLVHEEPLVSGKQLDLIQTMGTWYGISMATIAKMMLLPMQKRKLKTIALSPDNLTTKKSPGKTTYHHYKTPGDHKNTLQNISQDQTLILVPETQHIDEVFDLLTPEQQEETLAWYSGLSTKEKFEKWLQVRNSEKRIIIGTRGAVLLPYQHLENIIIDFEHKENHKHWDQTPRFHTKDVAGHLAQTHGATLHLMSHSPSVESYFHIHKKNFQTAKNLELRTPDFEFINMANERRGGNYDILSNTLQEKLLEAKQDVFLYINKLGYASTVGCNDCGKVQRCEYCTLPLIYHEKTKTLECRYCRTKKSMIPQCKTCKSTIVQMFGVGTEQVETHVRKLLGENHAHDIVRVDSTVASPPTTSDRPRILIGTKMAFSHVRWEHTGLIVFLDIDQEFRIPEFGAGERAWHTLHEVEYRKHEDATCLVQTVDPGHLVPRSLTEPDRFYRTDLNLRRSLGYPPYMYLVRYFYGHPNQNLAKSQAEKLFELFGEGLTKRQKSITVLPPLEMHPRYYRGKFWYTILVKVSTETWQEDLVMMNKLVPNTWRIDPNPISILSP